MVAFCMESGPSPSSFYVPSLFLIHAAIRNALDHLIPNRYCIENASDNPLRRGICFLRALLCQSFLCVAPGIQSPSPPFFPSFGVDPRVLSWIFNLISIYILRRITRHFVIYDLRIALAIGITPLNEADDQLSTSQGHLMSTDETALNMFTLSQIIYSNEISIRWIIGVYLEAHNSSRILGPILKQEITHAKFDQLSRHNDSFDRMMYHCGVRFFLIIEKILNFAFRFDSISIYSLSQSCELTNCQANGLAQCKWRRQLKVPRCRFYSKIWNIDVGYPASLLNKNNVL